MNQLLARCLHHLRRHWPALLLLGLVTIEVLGACGSVRMVRRARPARPLAVRYHIRRSHLFWVFTLSRDTTSVELSYRGQPLTPEACAQSAVLGPGHWQRPSIENAWRQLGPAPRWVLSTRCRNQRTLYLLRLPAAGPEFIRLGPADELPYRRRLVLQPVAGGPVSYLPLSSTAGWLLNETTRRSEAIRLPEPADLWPQPWAPNVAYTVSPDLRVLARVYRPNLDTARIGLDGRGPARTGAQPRLVIDQYDLGQRSTRRLTVEGVNRRAAELLPLTEWTQTAGRWELLPRP